MTEWVSFSEVKARVSFHDVFAFYELLDAAEEGKNHELSIRCPFHDGAKRLLKAHTEKGVFKCFAPECDKKGNVIDFAAAMEGLSFRTAALFLQEQFMKPTDKASPGEGPGRPRETSCPRRCADWHLASRLFSWADFSTGGPPQSVLF